MIGIEKVTPEKVTRTMSIENVSRRNFLQGLMSASAFVLCVGEFPLLAKAARSGAPTVGALPSIDAAAFHPGLFVPRFAEFFEARSACGVCSDRGTC